MSVSESADRKLIEETAARWVMRRDEAGWSREDQTELDAWLDQSMAHKAAFWRLEHGWRRADRLGSLGEAVAPPRRPSVRWSLTSWQPSAIAASLAALMVGLLIFLQQPWSPASPDPAQQTFVTEVGGRKQLPLADGSRIELNTATVLRAAVTEQRREVWLDRGEAYFEVRHSDRVPFVVHAGLRTVTVLGTKFSVRRDGDRVAVSVVEGRVRIDVAGRPGETQVANASSTTVTGGDVAIAQGRSTLLTSQSAARIENALAWRDGMLSFDQSSLADVATEFNRYNERKLVIVDDEVAAIRIGGTFQASNVDAFVRLLRDAYGLRVEADDGSVKISG